MILGGCTSTKTVYPTECKVESSVRVQSVDEHALEKSKEPLKFSDSQLKGIDNATAIKLISKNNSEIWQEDRNKLKTLQDYVILLQESGIIPNGSEHVK